MRTHLLAAHFSRSINLHGGDFGTNSSRTNSSLHSRAADWATSLHLRRARVGDVVLTIVHDAENASVVDSLHNGVALLRLDDDLASLSGIAANDLRWLAYERLLDARWSGIHANDCVVAIDLGDVGLIGNATALCDRHPTAILAGSDSCGIDGARGVKTWLQSQAHHANYSLASSAPWLRYFLHHRSSVGVVFNCGIAGGQRSHFAPFVREMADAIRQHHAQYPVAWRVIDMIVFNEIVLRRLALHPSQLGAATPGEQALSQARERLGWNRSVVTGWPLGGLNLPMFASFCGRDPCSFRTSTSAELQSRIPQSGADCLRRHVLRMAPAYVFVHKVPYLHFPLPQRAWTRGYRR